MGDVMTLAEAIGGKNRVIGGPFGSKLTQKDYVESGIPVIRGSNMEKMGRWLGGKYVFVTEDKVRRDLSSNLAYPGDLVVTQRGTMGQASIVPPTSEFERYVISQSQMAISVDEKHAHADFVYYYLRSPEFLDYVVTTTIQTGVPHINLGLLRDAPVAWPQLDEQKSIASILCALDDKIELNRQTNETLETLARAIFKDWFVDFGPTRAKAEGRDPYLAPELWALFPDALDDEDRPVGWQEKKLSEIIDRLPAGKLYDQKTVLPVGKVPVFDQGKSGIIGYHNNKPNIIASQKKRVATFANHTCLLRIVDHPFSTIQNVIPFIGSKLPTEWVYFATIGKQNFEEYKGHWPSLMNKDITVPNASSTEMFAMIVDTLLNKISFNNKESDYLAKTRDLLLPKLMSGEICLRETEKFVEAAT